MKSMEIRVDTLPPEGREIAFHFPPAEVEADLRERGVADVSVLGDLTGKVRLMRSGADLYVMGHLSAPATMDCVRCLEGFDATVATEFHLTFSADLKAEGGGEEKEVALEELEIEPLTGETLDLAQLVAEQFVLALPPYPVCRESCRGLCPRCGSDLNTQPCGCDKKAVDPRFAALEKLSGK